MNDWILLTQLLQPEVLVKPGKYQPNDQFELHLEESGHATVVLQKLPCYCLAFRADQFPDTGKFLQGEGVSQRCDFVILAKDEQQAYMAYILFVELKGGKKSTHKEISNQLRGGQCLLDYLVLLFQAFPPSDLSADKVNAEARQWREAERRYVAFTQTDKPTKKPSRYQGQEQRDGQSPTSYREFTRERYARFDSLFKGTKRSPAGR